MTDKQPQLGFGAMRLPSDTQECRAMFSTYLDSGYNYFDTAYIYDNSEEMLQKALVNEHPRNRYLLADKLPPWKVKTIKDCDRILEESLKRCGVEYFDYYLLHSMGKDSEQKAVKLGLYEWAAEQKQKGLCRHIGFSFHDSAEVLEEMLSAHPEMEFAQLQLNYMDVLRGHAGLLQQTAVKHNKPIIVMEPVKGGSLAKLNAEAEALLKAARPGCSAASWAMRYAASLEGVHTVLSGMSNLAQVQDNVATFSPFEPLSEAEHAVLEQVLEALAREAVIPCTACKYCVADCPQQIEIPVCFSLYNECKRAGERWNRQSLYYGIPAERRADGCKACGVCLSHCPQGIDIPARLAEVAKLFK